MSGELVEVLGASAWFHCGHCPGDLKGKKFSLRSSDGEAFGVDAESLCSARNTIKLATSAGASAVIDVPLKKSTLAKVVDYCKYHRDIPPAEIQTPLQSENLVDCGALKWDAAFINVEKDLLFELLLAAIIMDIPSLIFLAAAKASLLIKGRTPDKLLRDFKMSNDLPEEEDETLSSLFAAQKEKLHALPDESGLGGVALIVNGILQAAERNGILSSTKDDEPAPSTVSLKSFRHASWRAMVLSDWTQLGAAPPEVRADRDLLFAAIRSSRGAALTLAPDQLRADRKLVLEAVACHGGWLSEAAPSLRGDRSFVREAVGVSSAALAGASDQLRGDRGFVLSAVAAGHGAALGGAADALKADRAFVLECAVRTPEAFKHAVDALRYDRSFALEVAGRNGGALQYMPPAFQADREVVKAAVATDPSAIVYAHTAARADMNLAMPWDSEPALAAARRAQDEAGVGASEFVPPGLRVVGIPLTKEAADADGISWYRVKAQKIVQFSALSVMVANMGQANYIASNSYLDKLPFFERPEIDAVTLMWGAVGNIGMRWKAFASQDMLNANPEALMSVMDAAKVLRMTTCRMDPPEWYAASFFDEWTKQAMLKPTAGVQSAGRTGPGEDYTWGTMSGSVQIVPRAAIARTESWTKRQRAEVEAEEEAELAGGPLGGWPSLAELAAPVALGEAGREIELVEGVRVALSGLQAKNGATGTLLKRCADGKWQVRMHDGTGVARLSACYLVVVSPPSAESDGDAKAAAAARRAQAMEERRARLKAKADTHAQSTGQPSA